VTGNVGTDSSLEPAIRSDSLRGGVSASDGCRRTPSRRSLKAQLEGVGLTASPAWKRLRWSRIIRTGYHI
jgi:hypothetical protein